MKRLVLLVATALVAAGATSVVAVGKPVERFNDHFAETFPDDPTTAEDDFCGEVPVTTTVEVVQNGLVRLDRNGVPLFRVSGRIETTWTNRENGLSVTNRTSGAFRDIRVVENTDGTTTIYSTNTGVAERLQTGDGTVLIKDVGRIVFATTFDFGDPDDPEDDELISSEIVSISGPHPEAESDFTLFCDAALEALT